MQSQGFGQVSELGRCKQIRTRYTSQAMPAREPTDRTALAEAAIRAALHELREAGGEKQYIYCRFGYGVASRLVAHGWALMDAGPTKDAFIRITLKGRIALAE